MADKNAENKKIKDLQTAVKQLKAEIHDLKERVSIIETNSKNTDFGVDTSKTEIDVNSMMEQIISKLDFAKIVEEGLKIRAARR